MDLRKPDNLSPNLKQAYDFLRDSQINSMMMDPLFFCSFLNDYIFFMNKKYNMYILENNMSNRLSQLV